MLYKSENFLGRLRGYSTKNVVSLLRTSIHAHGDIVIINKITKISYNSSSLNILISGAGVDFYCLAW
uniref:Uncharacterized protein n=1 Tax=Rhizophora mucronata TaxID=61149 RepID=A0A2P2IMS7_RHIMU